MTVSGNAPLRDVMQSWMSVALDEARRALAAGEAPIGAVLIDSAGRIMGKGYNTMRTTGNPTTHAEINAFTSAAGQFDGTHDLCLVTTLEPCVMCTGAAMQAGVTTIVYALEAPADAGTSRVSAPSSPDATSPDIIGGIAAAESRALFVEWIDLHDGDDSREDQRKFVTQLLTLTAGNASAVMPPAEAAV